MGETLQVNVSKSNPSKQYRIIQGNDGVIYCECMGWKMHKDCRHLRDYLSGKTTITVPRPRKARGCVVEFPVTTPSDLQLAVDAAVNTINKRG